MPVDLGLQLELALRLLVAAALGAAVGVEREIHEHPAGMRTHLLVALGSAIFTELSIYGFVDVLPGRAVAAPDPTRIAAQIVSGIGFLGAGAILKYGTSIRGLTTAASLWAVAAIGLASGAGAWVVAGVGAIIVIFSLWPLNRLALRLRGQGRRLIQSAWCSPGSRSWARSPGSSSRTGSRSWASDRSDLERAATRWIWTCGSARRAPLRPSSRPSAGCPTWSRSRPSARRNDARARRTDAAAAARRRPRGRASSGAGMSDGGGRSRRHRRRAG